MQTIYGKQLTKEDVLTVNKIASECGIMFDTARLLLYRNIDTVEKAKRFLNPSSQNFNDALLFSKMKEVVERITLAKERNQSVLIFGDYDADGICATTVLYYCLKEYGIDAFTMIPEREDGYGLNVDKVLRLHEKTPIDLVITVDCGISDKDKIENLIKLGIDVIVTDHHEPPEDLPDCLIVNPKVKDETYPFDGLSGAGVAYKVGYALIGKNANKLLDFVALSTVADSMPLIDENRDIVSEGLKLFSNGKIRPLFKHLLNDDRKPITSQTLAYQIAPRVNAGGRMGDAYSVLKLFTTQDEQEMFDLAVLLNNYNMMRQEESERVYNQAKAIINTKGHVENPIICVKGDDWSSGVLGIVSAKLVEEYNRPVMVFASHGDFLKGSARTVDLINIHAILSEVQDKLLGFGGHSQAAGISVREQDFDDFYQAIIEKMNAIYGGVCLEKTVSAEWDVEKPISIDFAKEIEMLEPFGTGNKKPLFTTLVTSVDAKQLKTGSPHYSFETDAVSMLLFNGEEYTEELSYPITKKILFEVNLSSFRGKDSVKGFVKRILPENTDFSLLSPYLFRSELLKLKFNESKVQKVAYDKDVLQRGYGTLYAISDYNNLKRYENVHNLSVYPFEPEFSSGENCVVIAPKYLPEAYKKVVYLDKPFNYLTCNVESYLVDGVSGIEIAKKLSIERENFASVFAKLCEVVGKPFYNSVKAFELYGKDFEQNNFIFCCEVFFDLGFFSIENGYLTRHAEVKNALTNSQLYSKILSIKGL